MEEKDNLDSITRRIIGAAMRYIDAWVRPIGVGYQTCLAFELRQMGLKVEEQRPLPVVYREVSLNCGYRLDLVVEDSVVVEIKAVSNSLRFMTRSCFHICGSPANEWVCS